MFTESLLANHLGQTVDSLIYLELVLWWLVGHQQNQTLEARRISLFVRVHSVEQPGIQIFYVQNHIGETNQDIKYLPDASRLVCDDCLFKDTNKDHLDPNNFTLFWFDVVNQCL